MRVAAVQFWGVPDGSSDRRADLARWVWGVGPGTDLIVCPELAPTPYVFASADEARAAAEDRDGPTFQVLSPIAKALRSWVVCGFVERDEERLYNSALVIDPTGELRTVYRKTLLYEADLLWATPGDSGYCLVETDQGSFAVGICMDLNDPRFVAWLELVRPTALAFPTNWLEEGDDVWSYWAWRLQACGTSLVAANCWGREGETVFAGRSVIMHRVLSHDLAPRWRVLASASATGDTLIRAELPAPISSA
ncbi:MAG: carbon-nitrogen hydrolase family protein [Myxococcota bacterium]